MQTHVAPTNRHSRRSSTLGWAVLALAAAALILSFLGLFALLVVGVALAAAGAAMRRTAADPQAKSDATGILAAGCAIALVAIVLGVLLIPTGSGTLDVVPSIEEVTTSL